jgi:hypothetical protein
MPVFSDVYGVAAVTEALEFERKRNAEVMAALRDCTPAGHS